MYIKRHAEDTVNKLSKMFGSVIVTGPRQVGKTTMLKEMLDNISYVTLDDSIIRNNAIEYPTTFIKDNPPPVFIDEIQKAPQLFSEIKMYIDSNKKKGQFYLSGSQQLQMMKNVSESLSGRIGILPLLGFSMREKYNIDFKEAFIPTTDYINERRKYNTVFEYDEIWYNIWRGNMPELNLNPEFDWKLYYGAYVTTYIERDIRDLSQVGDEIKFSKFMEVAASRHGQMLNLNDMARDIGVSQPTAERWLSILLASHIVYLLKPYSNNLTKRAVKTPKLYFLDSGLAAYLSKWNTPQSLKSGAMAGAYFEGFVLSEILKSYYNKGIVEPPIYYYRDKDNREIDIIIEDNAVLYPIEIKAHADPSKRDIKQFELLDKLALRGEGSVICMYDKLISLSDKDKVIPVGYL